MASFHSSPQAGSATGLVFLVIVVLGLIGGGWWLMRPSEADLQAKALLEHSTAVTINEPILGVINISGPPREGLPVATGMLLETASYFLGLSPPPVDGADGPGMPDDEAVAMAMLRSSKPGELKGCTVAPYAGLPWLEQGKDLQEQGGVLCYRGKPFVLINSNR